MDPITVLGAASSVVGIADFAFKLAQTISKSYSEIASTEVILQSILDEVGSTGNALRSINGLVQDEEDNVKHGEGFQIFTEMALLDVKRTAEKCLLVFWRIEGTILETKDFEKDLERRRAAFHKQVRNDHNGIDIKLAEGLSDAARSFFKKAKWSVKGVLPKLKEYCDQLRGFQLTLTLMLAAINLRISRQQHNWNAIGAALAQINQVESQKHIPSILADLSNSEPSGQDDSRDLTPTTKASHKGDSSSLRQGFVSSFQHSQQAPKTPMEAAKGALRVDQAMVVQETDVPGGKDFEKSANIKTADETPRINAQSASIALAQPTGREADTVRGRSTNVKPTVPEPNSANLPFLRIQESRIQPNTQPPRILHPRKISVGKSAARYGQIHSNEPNTVGPSTDREVHASRERQGNMLDTSDSNTSGTTSEVSVMDSDTSRPPKSASGSRIDASSKFPRAKAVSDASDSTKVAYIIREGTVHQLPHFYGSGLKDKISNKINFWSSPKSAYKQFAFLDDDSKKAIQSLLEDIKPSSLASVKMEFLRQSSLRLSKSKESAILLIIQEPSPCQNENDSSTHKSSRRGTQRETGLHSTTAALHWDDYLRELTTYKVVSIQPLLDIQQPKDFLDADSWASCTGSEQALSKGTILRRLAALDKDGMSISDKKARLQSEQREQVHRALKDAASGYQDPFYQWALRQLETVKSSRTSLLRRHPKILALVIYLERSPRPDVDLVSLYDRERQRGTPSGAAPYMYARGAPAAMPGMHTLGLPPPPPPPLHPLHRPPPPPPPQEIMLGMELPKPPSIAFGTSMPQPRPAQFGRDAGPLFYQAPPGTTGTKSEFGRMFSGIGGMPSSSAPPVAMPRGERRTPAPMTKTTYTRMARKHLSLEALRAKAIEFEVDVNPDYVIIKRWVPPEEQDELWSLTRTIRDDREKVTTTLSIEDRGRSYYHRRKSNDNLVPERERSRSPPADFGVIEFSPPDRYIVERPGESSWRRAMGKARAYAESEPSVITPGTPVDYCAGEHSERGDDALPASQPGGAAERWASSMPIDSRGGATNGTLPPVDDDIINMLLRRWTPGNGETSTEQIGDPGNVSRNGEEATARDVCEETGSEHLEAAPSAF